MGRAAVGARGTAHGVIAWKDVGETEGTGIVHIAPGCGKEDFKLGKEEGLPPMAPLDEAGVFLPGFGPIYRDARRSIPGRPRQCSHRSRPRICCSRPNATCIGIPHCWRCKTELLFRLVDEWFINMSWPTTEPDPRDPRQVTPSGLDQEGRPLLPWIPGIRPLARELDWLRNMGDWMISKKRYWGLALPIWVDEETGDFEVIGSREELKTRAVEGWGRFDGHSPHRPWIDLIKIRNPKTGNLMSRVPDVGNPWLDAGIVPYSTHGFRDSLRIAPNGSGGSPADFITESFPGQFRNWFYAILAMSTMMEQRPPFQAIFGSGTLVDRGQPKPMHKSAGNAIDFDEAAERMGVDVMRWLFATARPEENIRFGWHAADEARRRLLLLWNVYAFFVTYARLASWTPRQGIASALEAADQWPALDRWILSRVAGLTETAGHELADYNALESMRAVDAFIEDLSTWYLRRSRDRMRAGAKPEDREIAFATLHATLILLARTIAPLLPFVAEVIYQNLVVEVEPSLPDSVHLTRWPSGDTAGFRDEPLEASMAVAMRAVELIRTLRAQAGLRTRQPIAKLWLALPGGELVEREALLSLVAAEVNVKAIELIGDESELVERRVKVLLPKVGKRLGAKIPDVMAAAREGRVEIRPDGTVALAGITLAADEVHIQASPKPGTAVAHDQGLVVVIDTELTPELIAEGDARELQRAIQDLRRAAGLALDDRIDLWIGPVSAAVVGHLQAVTAETLGRLIAGDPPAEAGNRATVELVHGRVAIALRRQPVAG